MRFFSLLSLIIVLLKRGTKSKIKSQWSKWKNPPVTLWLQHQPSVLQRLWISNLRLKRGYLNILGLLWLFRLKHLLLFGVFILGGTMKQLYLAWRCTWLIHQFFFFAVKTTATTAVSFSLWCIRGGCKLSSWAVTLLAVSFPSVSRLICIQDAALHPDMNHWATCILEKPIL